MAAKPKPYSAFGQLLTEGIKRLAGDQSLTTAQRELAQDLGYSVSTIYRWRRGESLPQPQMIETLARVFIQKEVADRDWITRFLKKGLYGLPWPVDTIVDALFVEGSENRVYHSCFISYSSQDEAFAKSLYSDLRKKGVRCWFAPEDMQIGQKIRLTIDQSIQEHDKLLLILSRHSVASQWVEHEVEYALSLETKRKETVLFPVRIDNEIMNSESGWAAKVKHERHIGDFSRWEDHNAYQRAFRRLLRDLKVKG